MENQKINELLQLQENQINHFRSKGWISIPGVLDKDSAESFRQYITRAVMEETGNTKPLSERSTYDKAFLQIFNLWRKNEMVKQFVLSPRFSNIAAQLLGVEKVRIYHDQALYKEPGGGKTPWHIDQYYWPIDTEKTVTLWMPLVDIDDQMGILQFASETHLAGSELERIPISDESEAYFNDYIQKNKPELSDIKSYNAGDASFHYGWTLHYAQGNNSNRMREVMTVIYVADGDKVTQPRDQHQESDLQKWLPGLKPGDLVNSELNPVVG